MQDRSNLCTLYVLVVSTQIFWATMSCLRYCTILTFVFSSISTLCLETFDNYHECVRPCSDKPSLKRTCVYHFIITESHGTTRSFYNKSESSGENITVQQSIRSLLVINGKSPGPAIQICLGDTIEVLIYNKLASDELAFHWHGIRQKDSNYMDGVPMITQCPILPFGGFRYKITPESTGTYFYHAHSVSQQGDGVYGSLIVRGLRDEDLSLERTLVLSSRPSAPLTRLRYASLSPAPTPDELLVNGQAQQVVVRVKHGFRYLLRLINANAHDCPILLSTHGHALQILAADGSPVQPMMGTHIVLFPGERLDGILMAEQAIGKYALDIQGLRECRNLRQEAYIFYENATLDSYTIRTTNAHNFDEQSFKIAENGHHCHRILKNVICSLDLKNAKLSQLKEKVDETIYMPFDANTFSFFTDEMTDNSYNFYISRYYPAYLSLKKGAIRIPQINGMSFKYPPSPILSQPENILEKSVCSLNKRSSECADTLLFCECLQLLQVPPRKTIEIILINKGFGGNESYTFHLHGYNASVVARESFEQPLTKDDIVSLDLKGKIHRNLVNPVQKDTFVVPNKGYIILRFYTDNLGYWLWEARSTAIYPPLLGPGMQFLMRVGLQRNLPLVPIDFPSCGNNKGIDLIFES